MDNNLAGQPVTPGLVDRAKAVLTQPKQEWPRIADETTQPAQLVTGYAAPLAAIGPVASLIGGQLFGYGAWVFTYRPSLVAAVSGAVVSFVLALVSLFVVAWIANFLSPKFGGRADWPAAFRLTAYSMTAAWVAGIFGLIPTLGIIGLLVSLYSFYLFYLGAKPLLGVPEDKSAAYTAVTVVAAIVVSIVFSAVVTAVAGSTAATSGLVAAEASDRATIDLGGLGQIKVDGNNSTIDLGELGKVEIDGDTARVTANGESVEVKVPQEQ